MLGHGVITQINSAKINARKSASAALARGAKPARAKPKQTIGDLLISICELTLTPQRNTARQNPKTRCGLTKKAEPPPTRGVNRDSGTTSANGGWLRRLVRPHGHNHATSRKKSNRQQIHVAFRVNCVRIELSAAAIPTCRIWFHSVIAA